MFLLLNVPTQIERRKIDEMKLPEKLTFTLPLSNATSMKIATILSTESETLLETDQLEVKLLLVSSVTLKNVICAWCYRITDIWMCP